MRHPRLLLFYLIAFLLFYHSSPLAAADRYTALLAAKNLVLTTTTGQTYYYIVSANTTTLMALNGNEVKLNDDAFSRNEIKSVRIKNIARFMLDEDATAYDKSFTADHSLLALRRSLQLNQWNSIVLPVNLTGTQVADAFGQDARLARVRGFRDGDDAAIEFETISLDTDETVIQANQHYIIEPTREPDVDEGATAYLSSNLRPKGPIYVIPDVSLSNNQTPKVQIIYNEDHSQYIAQQGTYVLKDGSSSGNRKAYSSAYPLYQMDQDGLYAMHTDSVTAKAFTSWFLDSRTSQPGQLHFYIDGISLDATKIDQIEAGKLPWNTRRDIYDLHGRKVGTKEQQDLLPKGVYIIDGKKYVIK